MAQKTKTPKIVAMLEMMAINWVRLIGVKVCGTSGVVVCDSAGVSAGVSTTVSIGASAGVSGGISGSVLVSSLFCGPGVVAALALLVLTGLVGCGSGVGVGCGSGAGCGSGVGCGVGVGVGVGVGSEILPSHSLPALSVGSEIASSAKTGVDTVSIKIIATKITDNLLIGFVIFFPHKILTITIIIA